MQMRNNNTMAMYIWKVNKIFVPLLILAAIVTLVLTILSVYSTYIAFTALTAGVCLSAIFIYKKKSEKVIMAIILICINTALFAFIADLPGALVAYTMVGLGVLALYFRSWLIIIYGVITCGLLSYLQLAKKVCEFREFSSQLSCIIFATLIFFFLTKWGKELIQTANEKEMHANKLLAELNETMEIVKKNSSSLHTGIENCNSDLGKIYDISNSVADTIQEITKGVVEQTKSITEISNMVNEADGKISEINQFTKHLSDESTKASNVVLEGYQTIGLMNTQMSIINSSVLKSYSTVKELSKSMDDVNNFLLNINHIANQTNLLALNAAIEAARAGEAGKGFAVVADEVRVLAEQSANTVNNISQIIDPIKDKVEDALIQVQNGNGATQEGERIVKLVNEYLERIQGSFTEIEQYVSQQLTKIGNTAVLFSNVRESTLNISSISEQHAASTEELLAIIEEHNASIGNLYNNMGDIDNSSKELRNIIQD